MVTFGVLFNPLIPRHAAAQCLWRAFTFKNRIMLGLTRMANLFPLLAANELKLSIFEIVQDVNKLLMEG
jgi:hypothetical protein